MRHWISLTLLLLMLASPAASQSPGPTPGSQQRGTGVERQEWAQFIPALDTTIRTRHAAAFLATVPAGLLLVLYLYRRRTYLLAWIAAWLSVSLTLYTMTVSADLLRVTPASAAGRILAGVAQVAALANVILLLLAAIWFRSRPRVPRVLWIGGALVALWLLVSPVVFNVAVTLMTGYMAMSAGFIAAALAYLDTARRYRLAGAFAMAIAMAAIAATYLFAGTLIGRGVAGLEVPNAVLFISAGFEAVLALGMHLMVFEDMSFELYQTNVHLAAAQKNLEALAITDPLTRCYNRRFFEEVVGHELEQHRRMHVPLSLMFIDCDRFKAVNDTLGHETGDEVLRLIGNLLRNSVRQADYVFRWGGDEFLVLLTCDEKQAMAKAEEIRAVFRSNALMGELPEGVDLSIGCVEVPLESQDLLPLIQQADERMYAQKRRTA